MAIKIERRNREMEQSINERIIQLQGSFEREIFELKPNVDEEERRLLSKKYEKWLKSKDSLKEK